MGLPVNAAPVAGAERGPLERLLAVISLVRYRFFLYAGLVPYLLGAAWAYARFGAFDGTLFFEGLFGVVLAVIGVEAFNEYFDSLMGPDRVFNPEDVPPVADWVLWLGIVAFGGAFTMALFLAMAAGWPVFLFAVLGGLAAVFYVTPPIRWAYRGLGETVIGLSYGPWMVLGSLVLHGGSITNGALFASLVPGLLIMALAVINAIPDYHQDRLVNKRNLVVRLGRRAGVDLFTGLAAGAFAIVTFGCLFQAFPHGCLLALLGLPFLAIARSHALQTFERPRLFVPAIRNMVRSYLTAVTLFTLGLLASAWV